MSTNEQEDGDVIEREEVEKAPPAPLYRVILLNDDYTPMEFVVIELTSHFNKTKEDAIRIMLNVHNLGEGIAGIYPEKEANNRTLKVLDDARQAGHPLQIIVEPA